MALTLDALEVLDAVDRAGSFGSAARALHRAQSAVSYAIRQLEEALGVALFDRSGHRAVLTPAGRATLDEARGVLARVRRLEHLALRFQGGYEPHLAVIIDGILPMGPIMEVLRRLADERVPTRIQLKVEFLGGVQDRFEADAADLMLVKDYTRDPRLVARPLPSVACALVAAADHPLAGRRDLELLDLHEHVELTVHDSSTSRRLVDQRLFGGPRVFYLSDFNTKREALRRGLGYGWMPGYLIDDDLARGALVVLDYRPGARFTFTPALVHPVDRPLGRTGLRFFELLTAPGPAAAP
ncbi:MAG: LysR family transcriptional regulator [Myxococcales bacterium]|nr:LysR family transcriptional regulator [Myxococcales bacterium]